MDLLPSKPTPFQNTTPVSYWDAAVLLEDSKQLEAFDGQIRDYGRMSSRGSTHLCPINTDLWRNQCFGLTAVVVGGWVGGGARRTSYSGWPHMFGTGNAYQVSSCSDSSSLQMRPRTKHLQACVWTCVCMEEVGTVSVGVGVGGKL